MIEFILSCIVISIKGMLGTFFLGIAISLIGLCGGIITYFFNTKKIIKTYKGQKIVIQGGKNDE